MIRCRDVLWPAVDRPVLRLPRLELAPGGITAILGANGAGKSSLLRLMAGLLAPESGTVTWNGCDHPPPGLVWVAQEPSFVRASLWANVWLAVSSLPLTRAEKRARTEASLKRVGLWERSDEPAARLSGGERQRLALARAWARAPSWLLLDEPTANLDPGATAAIEALIAELAASGTTVVMSTHSLAQAARLSSQIVFLANGEVIEQRPTREFFACPQSEAAQRFLRAEIPGWGSALSLANDR